MEFPFAALGIDDNLVQHISKLGYTEPTPIQKDAIPILIGEEADFVGLASTGTGKTLAFALPLAQKIDANSKQAQALVLCPTRELAQQVSDQIKKVSAGQKLKVATIYGGSSYYTQTKAIKDGAQIIVATPGRLIDLIEQKLVSLKLIDYLILDEADEMLSLGFREALDYLLKKINEERSDLRIWLFSATMSPEIKDITSRYLKNPKFVTLSKGGQTASTVTQQYIVSYEAEKLEVLKRIIALQKDFHGLIFCRRREDTADVASALIKGGLSADCIHGEKNQVERERILNAFRAGKIRALVATDVAARGIDVKDLTHVINYSLPLEVEAYIHRIGRTGRNGKEGLAISLVTPSESRLFSKIERVTKQKITRMSPPSATDVRNELLQSVFNQIEAKTKFERVAARAQEFAKEIELPAIIQEMSQSELFAYMMSLYEPQIMSQKELPNMELQDPNRGGRGGDRGGGRSFGGGRGGERRYDRPSGGGGGGYGASRSFGTRGGARRDEGRPSDGRPSGAGFSESRPERSSEGRPDRGGFRKEGRPSFGAERSEGRSEFRSESRPSFGAERGEARSEGRSEFRSESSEFRPKARSEMRAEARSEARSENRSEGSESKSFEGRPGAFERRERPARASSDQPGSAAPRRIRTGASADGKAPRRAVKKK